jgi:hypothetical protein
MRSHLTIAADLVTELQIARTVPGMAHFGSTGPDDRCGRCDHWKRPPSVCGTTGAYPCGLYQSMMHVKSSPKISGLQVCCKYFRMRGSSS